MGPVLKTLFGSRLTAQLDCCHTWQLQHSYMAHPRPLIPLPPPVLNNVVRLPPQPQNPPTDNDLKYAAYFAKDVLNSHGKLQPLHHIYNRLRSPDKGRGEVRTSDLAAALKYKAVVIAKADHSKH